MVFSYGNQKLPIGRALVDTGSDLTILPLQVAHYLQIELDDTKKVTIDCAGGGRFIALPSQRQIGYSIDFRAIDRSDGKAQSTLRNMSRLYCLAIISAWKNLI